MVETRGSLRLIKGTGKPVLARIIKVSPTFVESQKYASKLVKASGRSGT